MDPRSRALDLPRRFPITSSSDDESEDRLPFEFPPTLSSLPKGKGWPLCTRCLTLLSHVINLWGDGDNMFDHHLIHSLLGSRAECPICRKAERDLRLALDAKEPPLSEPLKGEVMRQLTWIWSVTANGQRFRSHKGVYVRFEAIMLDDLCEASTYDAEDHVQFGGFECYPGRSATSTAPFLAINPVPSTHAKSSTPDVALMRKWYQKCDEAHTECRKDGYYVPARLITWQDDASQCRLVLNHELDGPVRYASLSHCWGTGPDPAQPHDGRIVLTWENLDAWRIQLPWASLARSMQHAIQVASVVGLHYAWIDNLCIVQNSPADWQQQSATMNDVYEYASLNIAALESAADEAGFLFAERDVYCEFCFTADFASILDRPVGEMRLVYRPIGERRLGLDLRYQECRLLGRSTLVWKGGTEPAQPLNLRAWVYQEKMFPRRTLGFQQNTMAWRCRQMERSESDNPVVSLRPSLNLRLRQMSTEDLWETVVREYSALKLTRQTDKLLAVSAIAKDIATPGTHYYAGLWSTNPWIQLGWRTRNGLPSASPRAHFGDELYVAPSWSWASVDCPCNYELVSSNFRIRSTATQKHGMVLDIRTEHIGFEFGQISDGYMHLRAYLHPAAQFMSTGYKKRKDIELSASIFLDRVAKRLASDPDPARDDTPDRGPLFINSFTGRLMNFSFDTTRDTGLDPLKYPLVRWMPLAHGAFLLLLQLEELPKGYVPRFNQALKVYRRIGIGTCSTEGERYEAGVLEDQGLAGPMHEFVLV